MIDKTKEIAETNVGLKPVGSKLTRLDLLLNKLRVIEENLNLNKKIVTIVYDKDEFVEKVTGGVEDTEEILRYYSENFAIGISSRPRTNEIIVRLINPIIKANNSEL